MTDTVSAHTPAYALSAAFGLVVILAAEALLFIDVTFRDAVAREPIPPGRALEHVARWVAINMTAVSWVGYLFLADGVLGLLGGSARAERPLMASPARRNPRRFVFCFLVSVPIWLVFDGINFSFMHAWDYQGIYDNRLARYTGYFVAFGTICPAMFLTAELFQAAGVRRVRSRPLRFSRTVEGSFVALGAVFIALPLLLRDPIGTVPLWLGFCFLLDPINRWFGAPSLLGDWRRGHWGRTLALMAGGLTCGFLWEFWNYWAIAKWTYSLPFLGPLEAYRYFEMPVVGLLGFLPFALECWVMYQTMLLLVGRLGLRLGPAPAAPAIL